MKNRIPIQKMVLVLAVLLLFLCACDRSVEKREEADNPIIKRIDEIAAEHIQMCHCLPEENEGVEYAYEDFDLDGKREFLLLLEGVSYIIEEDGSFDTFATDRLDFWVDEQGHILLGNSERTIFYDMIMGKAVEKPKNLSLLILAADSRKQPVKEFFQNKDTLEEYLNEVETLGIKGRVRRLLGEEDEKEAAWERKFLCDVNGDDFPELLEVYYGGRYYGDYALNIFDISSPYNITLVGWLEFSYGEKLPIYEDTDGNPCLLEHSDWQKNGYVANDIYWYSLNLAFRAKKLAGAEYYDDGHQAYNNVLEFCGESLEPQGYFDGVKEEQNNVKKRLAELADSYLEPMEITGEIWFDRNAEGENVYRASNFDENAFCWTPGYNILERYGKLISARDIVEICGNHYDRNKESLTLTAEKLDKTFSSDILNEFPNLRTVSFEQFYTGEDLAEKYVLAPSAWCEKIENLKISPSAFWLEDYSCFSNVKSLLLWERAENLEFLKQMPQLEVLRLECKIPSEKFLEPVFEMANLKVVAASVYSAVFSNLTTEERNRILERLSEAFICACDIK